MGNFPRAARTRLGAAVLLASIGAGAGADLTFDGSLGPTGSLAGDMLVDQRFGTLAGSNLFHSFEHLSVNAGESLHFAADAGLVERIIGRVTGFEATLLDGPVSADADLFVINPNGVVFGADASFDPSVVIEFEAADTLFFDDGSVFRVRDVDAAASLSIAHPDSFGFVSIATDDSLAPGEDLLVEEDGFALIDSTFGATAGANLFLSFSAFSLYPQQAAVVLTDPGIANVVARVTGLEDTMLNGQLLLLASDDFSDSDAAFWLANPSGLLVGSGSEFSGIEALHLGAAPGVGFEDGSVFDFAGAPVAAAPTGFELDASSGGLFVAGASVAPRARLTLAGSEIVVLDSRLAAPTLHLLAAGEGFADVDDPEATPDVGGIVEIENSDLVGDVLRPEDGRDDPRLAIVGGELVRIVDADLRANTAGRAVGRLRIRGGEVEFDNALVSANTQSDQPGEAPELSVSARGDLRLISSTLEADTTGDADAGDILLEGGLVEIADSLVSVESFAGATGNAGNIGVIGGDVEIRANSLLASRALSGSGDAGSVSVFADRSLSVSESSLLETSAIGEGQAGFVQLQAPEVRIDQARLESSSSQPGDNVLLLDQAIALFESTFDVTITATTLEEFTVAIAPTFEAALDIDLEATTPEALVEEVLQESDPQTLFGFLDTLPVGLGGLADVRLVPPPPTAVGAAGAVIVSGDTIEIRDGGIAAITAATEAGQGSLIDVRAEEVLTITGSTFESDTRGISEAGDIALFGPSLTLSDSRLFAESFDGGSGDAGNILLAGDTVLVDGASTIASRALTGEGDAGSATLVGFSSVSIEASDVETSSVGIGRAGQIFVQAPSVVLEDAALSSSSSVGGPAGSAGEAGVILVEGDVLELRGSVLSTITAATTRGDLQRSC